MRNAQDLAEALRKEPALPDDLRRARIERSLLEHQRQSIAPAAPPRRRRPSGFVVGIGVGVAAAAVALLVWRGFGANDVSVAQFESLQDGLQVRHGSLSQGDVIHTAQSQMVRVRLQGAERELAVVEVSPESRAVFDQVEGDLRAVNLARGRVRVEFHPERRGEQHFHVRTRSARVEVVGTVFEVIVEADGATHVKVDEGTVRVVPVEQGAEPRLVRAGSSLRVRSAAAEGYAESDEELPERRRADIAVVTDPALAADLEHADRTLAEGGLGLESGGGLGEELADGETEVAANDTELRPDIAALLNGTDGSSMEGGLNAPDSDMASVRPTGELQLRLVERLFDRGRFAQARHEAHSLARESRSASLRARAWTLIAEAWEREGELHQAAESYRRAWRTGGNTLHGSNALFALGRLRASLGERGAAVNAYQTYLREYAKCALGGTGNAKAL